MISLWKKLSLLGCMTGIISFSCTAQCAGSIQTITYDTIATGSGNDAHVFTLPQFNPTIGTLTAVNISSVVSVNYGFTLTNINSYPINFSIAVGRIDDFQSAVLTSPYNNSIIDSVGTFALNAGQTITQNPATVINRYDNAVNATANSVDFIGNGTIGFNYNPRTYTTHSGSSTYQYSATASDTIHFSVTYQYCGSIVLFPDLLSFFATKENNHTIQLVWNVVNEQRGRIYEVQESNDGNNFQPAGSVAAAVSADNSGNYFYQYQTTSSEKNILWFRLKITDLSGTVRYSQVKSVNLEDHVPGQFYLYPNPSDQFVNILFPDFKNWEVQVLASNGSVVQISDFINANMAHVNFNRSLSSGVYFARIIEQQTGKSHIVSFVVK